MSESEGPIRREVYYSGRVQGVGFRYTTRRIAGRYAVAGFVRNLPDGRVQIVAEGSKAEVDAFLGEVRSEFHYGIRDVRETEGLARGQFPGFEIRF